MSNTFFWIVIIFFCWYLFAENKSSKNLQTQPSVTLPTASYYQPSVNFNGYPCTIDCSGHEAGYDWAEENGITDPDDCDGNSDSFIEGCQSYAEEQSQE